MPGAKSEQQRAICLADQALQPRHEFALAAAGKGALEIGITLDKGPGLPYIPGSARKGACRNYALFVLAKKYGVPVEEKDFADFDKDLTAVRTTAKIWPGRTIVRSARRNRLAT